MANKYFDNKAVEEALAKYKISLDNDPNKKGDATILHPYTDQIQHLVRGVINVHKIYRFHSDVEELIQEGMVAIYASFKRFNPEKGSAFNYLSIVVKQHLKNWTQTKNRKDWLTSEYQDQLYIPEATGINERAATEDILTSPDMPEKFGKIIDDMIIVVGEQGIYHKRDIIKALVLRGWPRKDIENTYIKLEKQFKRKRKRKVIVATIVTKS